MLLFALDRHDRLAEAGDRAGILNPRVRQLCVEFCHLPVEVVQARARRRARVPLAGPRRSGSFVLVDVRGPTAAMGRGVRVPLVAVGLFELLEREVFVVALAHAPCHQLHRILDLASPVDGRDLLALLFDRPALVDEE
jgi:hypothetical protein